MTLNGPDGIPAVENVALLPSVAHFRFVICAPAVALMVTGSIASLKVSFSTAPESISAPSVRAEPSAVVTETTRGTMIVVNVHWLPPTR